MTLLPRRKVLITGACGGMGRACARLFGATDDLVLTDVSADALGTFVEELGREGFNVVAEAGDVGDEALLGRLVAATASGAPFAVVHTAGLSPALADWEAIMRVNLVATHLLLREVEKRLVPGTVAVLIASSAGHMMPALPEVEAALTEALAPGFMDRAKAIIEQMGGANSPGGMGGISYSLSKRAVIRLCENRAQEWGPRGARIVSVSPGTIDTPMGRKELEAGTGATMLRDATPIGRMGMPMDIALACQFLTSEQAGFITGTDLLVDGGGTTGMKLAMARMRG